MVRTWRLTDVMELRPTPGIGKLQNLEKVSLRALVTLLPAAARFISPLPILQPTGKT